MLWADPHRPTQILSQQVQSTVQAWDLILNRLLQLRPVSLRAQQERQERQTLLAPALQIALAMLYRTYLSSVHSFNLDIINNLHIFISRICNLSSQEWLRWRDIMNISHPLVLEPEEMLRQLQTSHPSHIQWQQMADLHALITIRVRFNLKQVQVNNSWIFHRTHIFMEPMWCLVDSNNSRKFIR